MLIKNLHCFFHYGTTKPHFILPAGLFASRFFCKNTNSLPEGLTFFRECAKFLKVKAMTKTCVPGKIPREDAALVKGIRTPALYNTTSELRVRKCHAGCAR